MTQFDIPKLKYSGAKPIKWKGKYTPKRFKNKLTPEMDKLISGKW